MHCVLHERQQHVHPGGRYQGRDYALAVAITAGVLMFFLTGPVSSKPTERTGWALAWGTALMFGWAPV